MTPRSVAAPGIAVLWQALLHLNSSSHRDFYKMLLIIMISFFQNLLQRARIDHGKRWGEKEEVQETKCGVAGQQGSLGMEVTGGHAKELKCPRI